MLNNNLQFSNNSQMNKIFFRKCAEKIINSLDVVKKFPKISAKNWIRELIQNAKDTPNNHSRGVSIKIEFTNDYLIFSHNGNPFSLQDIMSLAIQASGKNFQNLDRQNGNFGTGFIFTMILSKIIDINGIIECEGNKYRKLKLKLNREADNIEDMADNIEKICNKLRNLNEIFPLVDDYNINNIGYDTSFKYPLKDTKEKIIAFQGIQDLINTLPITLSFQIGKIEKVEIIDKTHNLNNIYFGYISETLAPSLSVRKIYIIEKTTDKIEHSISKSYLVYTNKNNCQLLIEIKKSYGYFQLIPVSKSDPVLYHDFPVIDANNFYFPFIINVFHLESILNVEERQKKLNEEIITKAYKDSLNFIKLLSNQNNILEKYLLLYSPLLQKENNNNVSVWVSNLLCEYRKEIEKINLIIGSDRNYYPLNHFFLPVLDNKEPNKEFYKIISKNNKRGLKLPQPEEYEELVKIIKIDNNYWNKKNYLYTCNDFFEALSEKYKSLNHLSGLSKNPNENQIINWLNSIYEFIVNSKIKYEKFTLFPNQKGILCNLNELFIEKNNQIPKEIKNLFNKIILNAKENNEYLSNNGFIILNKNNMECFDLMNYLLDNRICIDLKYFKIREKNIVNISEDINNLSLKIDINLVFKILSVFSAKNDQDLTLDFIYNNFIKMLKIDRICINYSIPKIFWENSKTLFFENSPKEIEKNCENLLQMKKYLNINSNEELINWLNSYIYFYYNNDKFNIIKEFAIFPNQKEILCKFDKLSYDNNISKYFKEILKIHLNNDIYSQLFYKGLLTEKDINYKKFTLKDVNKLIEEYVNFNEIDMIVDEIIGKNIKLEIAKELARIIPTDESNKIIEEKKELFKLMKNTYQLKDSDKIFTNAKGFDFSWSNRIIIENLINNISSYRSFENFKKNPLNQKSTEDEFKQIIKELVDYVIKYCDEDIKLLIISGKTSLLLNEKLAFNKTITETKINKIDPLIESELLKISSNKHINIDYPSLLLDKNLLSNPETEKYFVEKIKELKTEDIIQNIDEKIRNYNGDKQEENFSNLIMELVNLTDLCPKILNKMHYFSEYKNQLIVDTMINKKTLEFIVKYKKIENDNDKRLLSNIMDIMSKNDNISQEKIKVIKNLIEEDGKINYVNHNDFLNRKYIRYGLFKNKITPEQIMIGKKGESIIFEYLKKHFKDKVKDQKDIEWMNEKKEQKKPFDLQVKLKNNTILFFEVKSTKQDNKVEGQKTIFGLSCNQMKKIEEVCKEYNKNKYYIARVYNALTENPKIFFFEAKMEIDDEYD